MRAWSLAPAPMVEPSAIRSFSQQAEADGWHGVMFPDNQCLWGDTFVSMAIAAEATGRLRLANASTNPGTRHPAVTASAISAINLLADGRAELGIARGDSALAHVGSAPVSVADFDAYLACVRSLVDGGSVAFSDLDRWRPGPAVGTLPMDDAPDACRLRWLPPDAKPVLITVFASGPKTIAVGARHADQVMFGLGADVDRLRWAVDMVRTSCVEVGRDPSAVRLGALMSIGISDDMPFARGLVANIVASSARFSSMHGTVAGPVSASDRRVYEGVATNYNMRAHGETSTQVRALTDDFIDTFALVGSAERCIARIKEIHDLGIEDVMLMVPRNDTADAGAAAARAVVGEVVPAIRDLS